MVVRRVCTALVLCALLAIISLVVDLSRAIFLPTPGIRMISASSRASLDGLQRGQDNQWFDSFSNGPPANQDLVKQIPLPPINLVITDRARDSVELDWENVATADSYQVYLLSTHATDAQWKLLPFEGVGVSLHGSSAYVSGFTDSHGFVHTFAVSVMNDVGISDLSAFIEAPPFLEAPKNLNGNFQWPRSAGLSWQVVPNAESYQVGFRLPHDSIPRWVILPFEDVLVSISGVQAVLNPLPRTSDSEYHFAVRAIDGLGVSDWSETLSLQHGGLSFTVPIASTHSSLDTVILNWPNVQNASSYTVRFWKQNQWWNLPTGSTQVSIDGNRAVVSQLPSLQDYNFQVRAMDENGKPTTLWSGTIRESN